MTDPEPSVPLRASEPRAAVRPMANRRRLAGGIALSVVLHAAAIAVLILRLGHEPPTDDLLPPPSVSMVFEGGSPEHPGTDQSTPDQDRRGAPPATEAPLGTTPPVAEPATPNDVASAEQPSTATEPAKPAPQSSEAPAPPTLDVPSPPDRETPPDAKAAEAPPQSESRPATPPPSELPPVPVPSAPAAVTAPSALPPMPGEEPTPPPPPAPPAMPTPPSAPDRAAETGPPPPNEGPKAQTARPRPAEARPAPRPSPGNAPPFPAPTQFALAPTPEMSGEKNPGKAPLLLGTGKDTGGLSPFSLETDAEVGPDWRNALAAWIDARKYYPSEARRLGQQGETKVLVTAMPDGRVLSVELERPSGSPWLDLALEELFRGATLPPMPKQVGEKPVPLHFTMHYVLIR